jgi:hypothetical protein
MVSDIIVAFPQRLADTPKKLDERPLSLETDGII